MTIYRSWVHLALLLSALSAIALLVPAGLALANGSGVEIFRGRDGSYEVAVSILPADPVIGTVHFSIIPLDASTSLPVTDAEVTIVAHDEGGEPRFRARALNTPDSPQFYDANITFDSAGAWTLLVEVRNDDLGEAAVTVPLRVEERALTPGAAGSLVLLGAVVVLVGGALYIWFDIRRRRARV